MFSVAGLGAAIAEVVANSKTDADEERSFEEAYQEDGFAFTGNIFNSHEMDDIEATLMRCVEGRPSNLAPEDLLNLHMTDESIFQLASSEKMTALAARLLGTEDVSIFTTRILCKLPKTGKEIPWHQDSNYWPLIPPGKSEICPTVASLWLAVDDVDAGNGPMELLGFNAYPASRGKNIKVAVDTTVVSAGFDNFNITATFTEGTDLTKSTWCHLKRGEAEMHSAWTLHRSDPNTSDRRRCAWIVRYCPTGTRVVPGMRDSFPADYNIVPVRGKGALSTAPNAVLNDGCSGCNVDGDVQARRYAPCFGGKAVKAFNV